MLVKKAISSGLFFDRRRLSVDHSVEESGPYPPDKRVNTKDFKMI